MPKFKDPLSQHQWNCLSYNLKGAQRVNVDALVKEAIETVPQKVKDEYGFEVKAWLEVITIGGIFSRKDHPGILFSFPDHPKYAQILVGFNKIGGILDIEGIQYGTVSKNMQHANMAQADHGFSISGIAKAAIHKAMTDTNAVEEETMHYQALIGALEDVVQSWME